MSSASNSTLGDGNWDMEGSANASVIEANTSQAACPCRKKKPKRNKCSKSRSRSRKKKRCRAGMKTRNPFFNFMRDYRRKHCGQSAAKTAKKAAKKWNKMDDEKKLKYVKIACKAKPYKKKVKRLNRKRSRTRSRSRGKRCR